MGATEPLRAHHSLRSEQKREAVLAAARAMIRCGRPIEWVALAERAGVSEKFIHDPKHADIKAQVKEMIAVNSGQQAERQAATDQVTIASLRVELLNLRAHLKRKDAQLAMLERKLSHHAGQQLEASCPASPGRCSSRPTAPRSARSSSRDESANSRRSSMNATERSSRSATRCAGPSATATPRRERGGRCRHRPARE